MRYVYIITAFIFGCVLTYLAVSIGTLESIEGSARVLRTGSVSVPAFLDFISVMLTALTAVLAALAIGIGVVAAYTFGEIRNVTLPPPGYPI